MTVLAVKNGAVTLRKPTMQNITDRASGFGMVRFNKKVRTITCECWPFDAIGAAQFETWPVVTTERDQYGRKTVALLPKLVIQGAENPVIEVRHADNGELVYAIRATSAEFQPHVFVEGLYTVRISEPEAGAVKDVPNLRATAGNTETVIVKLI